jgi:hypothetical protein
MGRVKEKSAKQRSIERRGRTSFQSQENFRELTVLKVTEIKESGIKKMPLDLLIIKTLVQIG